MAHEHQFIHHAVMEYVPCDGGGHTTFVLLLCRGCGAIAPFPRSNYELTTATFREDFIRMLPEAFHLTDD